MSNLFGTKLLVQLVDDAEDNQDGAGSHRDKHHAECARKTHLRLLLHASPRSPGGRDDTAAGDNAAENRSAHDASHEP